MSNLVNHARRELAGMLNSDEPMNKLMAENLIELIETFANQGHSGFSASYTVSVFKTLASFEPFGPLTGDDHEWVEVSHGLYQNNRCSRVFKEDGKAYDIEGIVFRTPGSGSFTSRQSRVYVTFPYTPTTLYVNVPEDSTPEQRKTAIDRAKAQEQSRAETGRE